MIQYGIELLLRLPSDTESICLKLKDWNEYLKDKNLGVVVLPLNKISKQANVENHTIDGGGTLKLCTRHLGTIPGLPGPRPVEELPKVRIHLEHTIYHPGEVVRGYLVFTDVPQMVGEKGRVYLGTWSHYCNIHYLSIAQQFEATRGGSRIWGFQFLIPKTIPTRYNSKNPGAVDLSIDPPSDPQMTLLTKLIIMPIYDGLEPNLSPRRKEKNAFAPTRLSVTWGDIPKVLNQEKKHSLTFKLVNSGFVPEFMKSLTVAFGRQEIDTELREEGVYSREYMRRWKIAGLDRVRLDPCESRELRFAIDAMDSQKDLPREPSAPFEVSGDIHECNYFLEVSVEPPTGDRFVVDRKPIFWTSESLTRAAPPNYEITMKPHRFYASTIDEPDSVYSYMAPSAVSDRFLDRKTLLADPIPTKQFSKSRRETVTDMMPEPTEIRSWFPSIFDVPFLNDLE